VHYIHQNPVERGLVRQAAEYRYSSAFPGFRMDVWPVTASVKAELDLDTANLRR
jgi:hypothetical protein